MIRIHLSLLLNDIVVW